MSVAYKLFKPNYTISSYRSAVHRFRNYTYRIRISEFDVCSVDRRS